MKFVGLLRGINVGGKNIIKMADLKLCFEQNGFRNVSTYIQSGNVIFEFAKISTQELEEKIEQALSKRFAYEARVLVRSAEEVQRVLRDVPVTWNTRDDLRCYIAFIKEPSTTKGILETIDTKDGIDFIQGGNGVIYMSTILSNVTKSSFSKLAGKKIYQAMTIRNYATTQKIAALLV